MPIISIESHRRSIETICVLDGLRLDASRGDCIGIILAAMYTGREYIIDIAGEPKRQQTFTLGMVRRLDYELNLLFSRGTPR